MCNINRKYRSLLLDIRLNALANSGSELHVGLHDGDALGMLGTELGVNEEVDEIVLGGFLESLDGETLETDVGLVVVLDEVTNKLGEGELADQEISGLLILLDFTSGDDTLFGAADLLDTGGGSCGLASCLTGDGLTGSLGGGGGLTCCVFGASHFLK